jgi:TetR/AcrR family transcriptional regulator, fatty acid metabolism regulator protein
VRLSGWGAERSEDSPDGGYAHGACWIVGAAIGTIAEVGYARASLARIAARAGISRGLISYHFAGKDDLIKQVFHDIRAEGIACIQPRILAETTASGMLRAYILSDLAFMREHRNHMVAIVEIARNGITADGQFRFSDDAGMGRSRRGVSRNATARRSPWTSSASPCAQAW